MKRDPATLTAAQLNKELDKLDAESSKVNDALIEAGRGNETADETWEKEDSLSMRWRKIADRRMDLKNEISQRYGPGAPSRLPKGFGPRRKLEALLLLRRRRSEESYQGIGGVPWRWLVAAIGGAVVGGLILKIATDEPEISPDEEVAPVPPPPDVPNFPYIPVGSGFYLATAAGEAFVAMRIAAASAGISLPISTAWRSREWQQRLYDAYQAWLRGEGPWAPQAAKPGNSKHEIGLAVDLNGVDPRNVNYNAARRAWLDRNAAAYGWQNVGKFFKSPEPWHFEYQAPSVA